MQQIDQLNALLNADLSTVDTSRPLLKGLANLKCTKAEIVATKNGTGNLTKFTFATQEPMQAIDGRSVNPGYPVFHQMSLTPTEKYPIERIKEALAKFREGMTGSQAGNFAPIEQYIDMTAMVQLKPVLSDEFGDKTEIARFVKKG